METSRISQPLMTSMARRMSLWGTGIVGAALIVGGIVMDLRSAGAGIRAISAASIAAGVVMWVEVTLAIPWASEGESPAPGITKGVVSSEGGPSTPVVRFSSTGDTFTEQDFNELLTLAGIQRVLT